CANRPRGGRPPLTRLIEAVGHTSAARQASSSSSAFAGCRAKMDSSLRRMTRPGATLRDAPQSMHRVSTYQSPGAESRLRADTLAMRPYRVRPIPLPKSHVSQFSGVKRTMTDSDVLGFVSAYHLP